MISAGSLTVSLHQDSLEVALSRENLAQRLCADQTITEALARITQTYLICRHAQRAAAQMALHGQTPTFPEQQNVSLEIIEQTLWRWWIDWPEVALGEDHLSDFAIARKAIARFQKQPDTERPTAFPDLEMSLETTLFALLGVSWQEFRHYGTSQFMDWLLHGQALAARILNRVKGSFLDDLPNPSLTTSDLTALSSVRQFKPSDFCYTAALAEYQNDRRLQELRGSLPTLTLMLLARLLQLVDEVDRIVNRKPATSYGFINESTERLSWVITARGLLIHRVRLYPDLQRVKDYQVIAPTDLNFSSDQMVRLLLDNPDITQVTCERSDLVWAVLALDPCVSYNVEVGHA